MNELTELEKAYLAGFFDGDGCVSIGTRKGKDAATVSHYLQVIFAQADYDFLTRWRDKLDAGSIHEDKSRKNLPVRQRMWHWRLHDRLAEGLLRMMVPYLDIKQVQAEIALRFMGTKKRGGSCRPTSQGVLQIREHYKNLLHEAKKGKPEPVPEIDEWESLVDSQLCLFEDEKAIIYMQR